jgi:hypothetical protein
MLIVSPLVVIHYFNFPCFAFAPPQADPPLIVNADTMLTASITVQGFKTVAWRDAKIVRLLLRRRQKIWRWRGAGFGWEYS